MFRHEAPHDARLPAGRALPGRTPGDVSCFVMVPYAHGSYPAVGPGMKLSFRSGFRALRPVLSLGVSGMGLSSRSRFVPFASPPRSCGSALFRAYRMCARACVCAGAVRAPDCAREVSGRTSPVRSRRGFTAPDAALCAEKKKAAPETAFLSMPILSRFSPSQAPRRADYEIVPLFRCDMGEIRSGWIAWRSLASRRPRIRFVAPAPEPGPIPSRFGLAGRPEVVPRLRPIVGLWVWTVIFDNCPGAGTLRGSMIVLGDVSIDRLKTCFVWIWWLRQR